MPSTDGGELSLRDILVDLQDEILSVWVSLAEPELRGQRSRAEIESELRALYSELAAALETGDPADVRGSEFDRVRAVLADLSRQRALAGFSPTETAQTVFALKRAFLDTAPPGPAGARFVELSLLVDAMGLFTFETYSRARESVVIEQAEQLLELSTPVVKLWDGVLAVPLVGTLDSARTQVVTEKLLQTLVDTGSAYAIIDITGVPAVDTEVAQHLLKTVVAARLMGAECLISGIRPQIAQTIVALGIEFGDIMTKATLADALLAALQGRGVALSGPAEARPS